MILEGNTEQYNFDKIQLLSGNPLEGKNICVLGSSVVYGYASEGESIPEYLGRRFGCTYTKSAVSGTTLVECRSVSENVEGDIPIDYISRLKRINTEAYFDLFLCQLSTNDATRGMPLGEISCHGIDSYSEAVALDTSTVTGAIEYIINYARGIWKCPVVFFTGSHYDSESYDEMVKRLYALKDKYGIGIINLWNNADFNKISDELRSVYMNDDIHPTKAGYRDWWGPEIEKQLLNLLGKE